MIDPLIENELGIELPVRAALRFSFLSVPPYRLFYFTYGRSLLVNA